MIKAGYLFSCCAIAVSFGFASAQVTADNISVVATEGETIPQTGDTITMVLGAAVNDMGQVVFRANTSRAAGHRGLFTRDKMVIAYEGDAIGTTGISFTQIQTNAAINNSGQIVFRGLAPAQGSYPGHVGIFRGDGTFVANRDIPVGAVGREVNFISGVPGISDTGAIAFHAIDSNPPGSSDGEGIFLDDGSAVVLDRDTAADTGVSIRSVIQDFPLSISSSGEVAFAGPITPGNDGNDGIFSSTGGVISTLALKGDLAGTTGRTFTSFQRFPAINNNGDVAYVASTTPDADGNEMGIFDRSGESIVFEGDPAADLGVVFQEFINTGRGGDGQWPDVLINDVGQVAFRAITSRLPGPGRIDRGLFLANPDGTIIKIVFEGETLANSFGVEDAINDVWFAPDGLSDNFLVFGVSFFNGTDALFITDISDTICTCAL